MKEKVTIRFYFNFLFFLGTFIVIISFLDSEFHDLQGMGFVFMGFGMGGIIGLTAGMIEERIRQESRS